MAGRVQQQRWGRVAGSSHCAATAFTQPQPPHPPGSPADLLQARPHSVDTAVTHPPICPCHLIPPPNAPLHHPADFLLAYPEVDTAISPRCVLAEFTSAGPKLAMRVRVGWGRGAGAASFLHRAGAVR